MAGHALRRLWPGGHWPAERPGGDRRARAVITAREVEAAQDGQLDVPGDAVVTPAARDRARDLGVRLRSRPAQSTTLSAEQSMLAQRLATQLACELPDPPLRARALWCLSEGSCTDAAAADPAAYVGAAPLGGSR